MKRLIPFHFKYRWPIFFLTLSVAIWGSLQAPKIPVNLELDKLLPDNSQSVQEMRQISNEIGGVGHLSILIGPTQAPEAQLQPIVQELEKIDDIKYVLYNTEEHLLEDRILYLLKLKDFLKLRKNARTLFNKGKTGMINLGLEDDDSIRQENIKKAEKYFKDFQKDNQKKKYLLSKDKRYALIMVKPTFESVDLARSEKLSKQVDEILRKQMAGTPYQLLGRYIEKVKDTRQIEKDIQKTGIASFFLIIAILILGLGSFRGSLFVIIGVLLSLGMTAGIAYYVVGQINILTGFLIAILAGLSADYGIHLFKRYKEERAHGKSEEEALLETYHKTGRALFSSALSTAIAFLCLTYSDFRGFSELGIIAGLGIISVLIVFMVSFPLLGKFHGEQEHWSHKNLFNFYPFSKIKNPLILIVLTPLLIGSYFVEFEYDFNRMRDLSQETYQFKLLVDELYGKSSSPVGIMAQNREQADAIKSYIDEQDYHQIISKTITLSNVLPTDMKSRYRKIKKLKKLLDDTDDSEIKSKTGLEASRVRNWLNAEPYSREELPIHLKDTFGKEGSIVLLYPVKQIDNKYDLDELADVLRQIKTEFPAAIIGSDTLVFNEILNHIFIDGKTIVLVFLLGLLITFIIDFRSLRSALILESQMIFGIMLLLGFMGILGVRFTIINVGIIPAILAIGIDMGVHIHHRELEGYEPIDSAAFSAGPIHASLATTLVGFGSLFLSQAKLLNGIAWLATLGMVAMYAICMVIKPLITQKLKKASKLKQEGLYN